MQTDLEDQDEQLPCDTCKDKQACAKMADAETWAYQDQFSLCCDLCQPEFHDIDYWVLKVSTSAEPISEAELAMMLEKVEDEE